MPESQGPAQPHEPAFPRSPTDEYRKRPIVIQAVRYGLQEYADRPQNGFESYPVWLVEAIESRAVAFEFKSEDYWYFTVRTLEGLMTGGPDDWIIRGVEGELYPCARRIFRATYEAVA